MKIKDIEGKDFHFLFNELTDSYTRDQFPSKKAIPYINPGVKGKINETVRNKGRLIRQDESEERFSKEFTAVLSDSRSKAITCRVVVLPTVVDLLETKKSSAVHFSVCIQKLFIEEMCDRMFNPKLIVKSSRRRDRAVDVAVGVADVPSMIPFLSPSVFPERLPIEPDTFVWD